MFFFLLKSSSKQSKTLDPGLRRDDVQSVVALKTVIPAKAGIQRFSLHTQRI
jgi:hypothetical protein